MVTANRRQWDVRHVEFRLPSGCAAGEFTEVWAEAMREYGTLSGLPKGAELPGDWAAIGADGDQIVIHFKVSVNPGTGGAQ